jgi:peptidyl-tRNA hydrolase, PTH1 family
VLVVIGLGNPGPRYAATRHNAGFLALDCLARICRTKWELDSAARCYVATCRLAEQEVLLAKPQTFMNRSGESVLALQQHLDLEAGDLLIVVDDFLLDFGRLRFRRGGSDGGHNGLASVLEQLQTKAVPRLRLGIGQPGPEDDIIDFVLSDFGGEDDVESLARTGAEAITHYAEAGIAAAMNRYNGL